MWPFHRPRVVLLLPFFILVFLSIIIWGNIIGVSAQILAKSKLEKCSKSIDSNENLNCSTKIVINMAVPSGSSGREASLVAEVVEAEENSTNNVRTLRVPPRITINKSAAYALYELTYIRDVAYKPEEYFVQTRKCEPDADASVVQICERLKDDKGEVIKETEPICCPCGDGRRVPSSCGSFFGKMIRGKANTAYCLRFPGDWFHVFGIGHQSIGFSVRIDVKTNSKLSEVVVSPSNRTATSDDNFLRVSLVGDFAGYTRLPSFEDSYLVVPRQEGPSQPQDLGRNFSWWMLLERMRFTLDGLECNKIGTSYEAFRRQPDFCSSPYRSCLYNQLWDYHEADQNRINRRQVPFYGVDGRFERINQHPDAGPLSFSIGITEVINTDVLIELRADDIEYVYQRSPGKISSIIAPTFEALSQVGIAKITTKNIGEVEASYSLTFTCSRGISPVEEQYFIMKPQEKTIRFFRLNPTSDRAAKYTCTAILKDSDYIEIHRAECQFTTMATVLNNGTQTPFQPPKPGPHGVFETIKYVWNSFWNALADFFTGKSCRSKCVGFFNFSCHIQYVCLSWIVLFALFLAVFPTVIVLLWLLHQKGLFDPLCDWWEDLCFKDDERFQSLHRHRPRPNIQHNRNHNHEEMHHMHNATGHRRRIPSDKHGVKQHRRHRHSDRGVADYSQHLHQVHKNKDKLHKHHRHKTKPSLLHANQGDEDDMRHRRHPHHHQRHRNRKEYLASRLSD